MTLATLPINDQVALIHRMAEELVRVVRNAGVPIQVQDALAQAARALRVAVSQMRYALTYVTSEGLVNVNRRESTLSIA